jgi:hypothetical protein
MAKLSKKKEDVSFIDPVTMEVRCTFNQCHKKFTIEGSAEVISDNGNEYSVFYHECSECGQRVRGRGDSTKGWLRHLSRICSGEAVVKPRD